MSAGAVCRTLLGLFGKRGRPEYVRSDNGPEFIAKVLMKMLADEKVEVKHIEPGSPWQNGRNERFNGSLRDECLNLETFEHRDQARAVCRLYAREYNEKRPHSALGYRTPAEFAAGRTEPVTGSAARQRTPKACIGDLAHGCLYVRVASTEGAGQHRPTIFKESMTKGALTHFTLIRLLENEFLSVFTFVFRGATFGPLERRASMRYGLGPHPTRVVRDVKRH